MEHTSEDCQCEGKRCTKCPEVRCIGYYTKDKRLKSGLKSKCKICSNAESKEWRESNKEYDSERHKKYKQENEEKVKQREKEYKHKNRAAIRETEQSYWEKNREKQREKGRRNYHRHKERINEYGKEYRKKNADILREKKKAYIQANIEWYREYHRTYLRSWRKKRNENRPKMKPGPKPKPKPAPKLKVRQFKLPFRYKERVQNPEANRAKWKRYYDRNREQLNQRSAQWLKDNPRRHAANQAKRRTLKTQAGGSYTATEFKVLCETYNNTCLRCGRSDVKLTADHIMPISMGGSSDISNIQPLCFSCNSSKGAKFIDFRPQNP